ncbi:hypothetical protein GCM10007916_19750 [Psychromonas marina]|uniref:Co-chaperone DjlA N-terminal domain-containing protein n=1 Tax=Psychromonas marina TaxID=88364 RepID=A0ABQ6E115_9GAMM|nr:TerB family tellurite resistance protein [Psychromonas marina]GLS90908.1 hypothetical protein GCM10007916_19750 [Psychromonas marina]
MIKKLTDYLSSLFKFEDDTDKPDQRFAIASLLCAVSHADHETSDLERLAIKNSLMKQLNLEENEVNDIIEVAEQDMLTSTSIFDFTSLLSDLTHESRVSIIEMMWRVAYADNHLGEIEEAVIRRVAGLLYVPHSEFIHTKLKVVATL